MPTFTLAEYIELEGKAEYKNEFYRGEIRPMCPANRRRAEIAPRLIGLIGGHLRGSHCRIYGSRLRIFTPGEYYTYPELSVVCGEPKFSAKDPDTLLNPTLLVEILAPETEIYALGWKAVMYREIESLREMLLISQDSYSLQHWKWESNGAWLLRYVKGLDAAVDLTSIGYILKLSELYERVISWE